MKSYHCILTQSGLDNPSTTELDNSLGSPVVWTRYSQPGWAGVFQGVINANIPVEKTYVSCSSFVTETANGTPRYIAVSFGSLGASQKQIQLNVVGPDGITGIDLDDVTAVYVEILVFD